MVFLDSSAFRHRAVIYSILLRLLYLFRPNLTIRKTESCEAEFRYEKEKQS